jgi:hypothetical protein
MVYALADARIARKIPFVFATGYSAESIERRFEHVPVLQKPIEKDMLSRMFVRSEIAPDSLGAEIVVATDRGQATAI